MEKIVCKGEKKSFNTNKNMKNNKKLQQTKEKASFNTEGCGFTQIFLYTSTPVYLKGFSFCLFLYWNVLESAVEAISQ